MEKKITKRDRFNELLNLEEVKRDQALTNFIKHEIELLDRKNVNKKPSTTQLAYEGIKAEILATLEKDKSYTVTEIMKLIPACADFTNQRMSAIIKQMNVNDKTLERSVEKGRAYFKLM